MKKKLAQAVRADPFKLDEGDNLSDFKPSPPRKPAASKEQIRALSEAHNFPSRSATAQPAKRPVKSAPSNKRYWRTGRNVQLNVKVTAETISRFTALAQQTKLPQGELLRRALDAYEEKMTDAERMDTLR
jgi:chemotaxis protein histidine kinase CheA